MQIINHTPFPSIGWPSTDTKDTKYVTLLSRVKYRFDSLDEGGLWSLKLDPEQGSFFAADVFYDETFKEVQFESDFVPYKRCADLIINLPKNKTEYGSYGVEVVRYTPVPKSNECIKKILLKHMALKHLGVVHRADKERLRYTGTADKKWIETRAPKYPKDFDERHYNAAHPNLQLKQGYFEPGDVVMFHKYLPGQHKQAVIIPGAYLYATIHTDVESKKILLDADTILFDIENLDMDKNSIYVSYRHRIAKADKVHQVTFEMMLETALREERSA